MIIYKIIVIYTTYISDVSQFTSRNIEAFDHYELRRCVSGKFPTCSCIIVSSPNVELTCSAVYADSTYNPISAVFTWCVNGNCTTPTPPQRTSSTDGYAWISTSTFTTTYNSSSTYECGLTFGQPTDIQDPSLATNAPSFNHTYPCPFPC